jgi:hypothetical protein
VPVGQKIPASKLAAAAHSSNPTLRKRAALAQTFKKVAGKRAAKQTKPGANGHRALTASYNQGKDSTVNSRPIGKGGY